MAIAAISTPHGVGGIAIIRISGEDALKICEKIFKAKNGTLLADLKANTVTFGTIYDTKGKLIDEGLLSVFKAPNSYTGENTAEISCHGGLTVSNNVLLATLQAGAKRAAAGEFTKRAFLNGKMDLSSAEAVIDLINADSEAYARASVWQLEGAVSKRINEIKASLIEISAEFLAFVDYPDEDIADISAKNIAPRLHKAKNDCERLIKSFGSGSAIKDGVRCAIIGKPNAGKSSLMNLLSKREKSIVTHIAGTTRDIVENTIILGDVKLILSDTAGVREATDLVEKIGVEKTFLEAQRANLILCIFDGNTILDNEDRRVIEFVKGKKAIAIINKADLENKMDLSVIKESFQQFVTISAVTGQGQDELEKIIHKMFIDGKIKAENGELITNVRHKDCLIKALSCLENATIAIESGLTPDAIGMDIAEAISALGEITGQTVNEAIIADIFSRFCVGK